MSSRRSARSLAVAATLIGGLVAASPRLPAQQGAGELRDTGDAVVLRPTAHPAVPSQLSTMWYAPAQDGTVPSAVAELGRGARILDEGGNAATALPLVSNGALASTPLADYARYYAGLANLRLERFEAAEAEFAAVAAKVTEGHLREAAGLGEAEAREGRQDFAGAVAIYQSLLQKKPSQPATVWFKVAAASEQAGSLAPAVDAYRRVYYDYPLASESDDANTALTRLDAWGEEDQRVTRELARADALFTARRWADARTSYTRARPYAAGADRDRVSMRLAACDVMSGRQRQARDVLKGFVDGPWADEARFYYLSALRGLREKDAFVREAEIFAEAHRDSRWSEDVLNALASFYIVEDDDEKADRVFRELIDRNPAGRFAERAFWKAGWWSYRQGRFAEAARLFDRGAAAFPRSDYRPSWLYWSGRAFEQVNEIASATARYRLAGTDYYNSYYGRLALARLQVRDTATIAPTVVREPAPAPPFPTASRVATLIAGGLNQEALNELTFAQRMWGDSSQLTATVGLVQNRLGNLRLGINAMKRAYPQWMAAGGEALPLEIQKVIFPVAYWPTLQRYATSRGLDPYLVAALVAQESTFDPVIRSSANAIGLMQVLPSTGRQYARRLGIRPFSSSRLTDPDVNVRIGTSIFSEVVRRFGGVHFALAAYNAGDSRVVAWQRERPGMPQDEFIDDIPFPETQNYVKRILGTAEDYRRLYRSR